MNHKAEANHVLRISKDEASRARALAHWCRYFDHHLALHFDAIAAKHDEVIAYLEKALEA